MDNYTERIFKKKTSFKQTIFVVIGAFFVAFGILCTLLIPFGIFFLIMGCIITYFAIINCDVEYEYLIVNGDAEISKVMAKKSRKKLFEFSLGDVTAIYKYGSKELESEVNGKDRISFKVFTSGDKANDNMWYCFMLNHKGSNMLVTLEMDEKTLKHYEMVAKSKIKTN